MIFRTVHQPYPAKAAWPLQWGSRAAARPWPLSPLDMLNGTAGTALHLRISSAISIRNNWDVVLKNYSLPYVFVERLKDLERIRPGDLVLMTLNKMGQFRRQIKSGQAALSEDPAGAG